MRPDGEPATVGEALRHWATATLDHIVWLELLPAGTAGVLKAFTTFSPIRLRPVVGPKWALPLLPATYTLLSLTAPATSPNGFSIGSSNVAGVAMRYDKLAANYMALVQLASIRLWLRAALFRNHYLHRISSFGR
jgi:hypothetical protein